LTVDDVEDAAGRRLSVMSGNRKAQCFGLVQVHPTGNDARHW
jgi:hypothetical protein